MGNSSSSSGRGHQEDTVDFGFFTPQGVYTGPRDWNQPIVTQLIAARRLAPFYRPLDDYEESWDDDQILAARKKLPDQDNPDSDPTTRTETPSSASTISRSHSKRPGLKEPSKPEAAVYRGAVECPICFLYYPPNINHSRCCDQAICTECFVQIKRNDPTTTHVVSEPAACPYCVQDNFGVVYKPPPWRTGVGSDGTSSPFTDSPKGSQQSVENYPAHKRRQKSFGADSPEVVTTDQIRPDWEAKLAAVRAAVARRANRRIIMRQVGDRLIPVGVTSGRVHALNPEEAASATDNSDNGGSRRSRRRQQPPAGFEQYLGLGGHDLEEMMVMEAMRLSLIEHEAQQKKEAEERARQTASTGEGSGAAAGPSILSARSSSSTPRSSASLSPPEATAASSAVPSHNHSHAASLSANPDPIPPRSRSTSPFGRIRGIDESSRLWKRRSSNSPSYNILGAAVSAASTTASAVIGNGSSSMPPPSSSDASVQPEATSPLVESPSYGSVPAITVGKGEIQGEHTDLIPDSPRQAPTPRPAPAPQDSVSSSISLDPDTSTAYDQLASSPESSPESALAREPLLGRSDDSQTF